MITTQQLAELAGVSQSTVSRSLHDSPDISLDTRQRIQQLAKEHGYVARRRNKRQGGGKQGIGIILSGEFLDTPVDLYLETLFNRLYSRIDAAGYHSILLLDHSSEDTVRQIEQVIEGGGVAGFVLVIREHNHAIENCLLRHRMPHVYTQYFSRPLQKSMNIVDLDHYTGGYLATCHLLKLGHRRIATFTDTGSDYEDRTAGYMAALQEAGLPVDQALVFSLKCSFEGGYTATEQHWSTLQSCTALFAQTDMSAIGSITWLQDHGYSVPGHMSVVGFDDLEPGLQCRPRLTTIRQPIDEIARMTITRVLRLVEKEDTKVTHTFAQPKLVVRASTAPVP